MWLEKRLAERSKQASALQELRDAGLVMTLERQRALADAMMSPLHPGRKRDREELETVLARLKVPLSDEIISMRGVTAYCCDSCAMVKRYAPEGRA
jgi:hypothetical protein